MYRQVNKHLSQLHDHTIVGLLQQCWYMILPIVNHLEIYQNGQNKLKPTQIRNYLLFQQVIKPIYNLSTILLIQGEQYQQLRVVNSHKKIKCYSCNVLQRPTHLKYIYYQADIYRFRIRNIKKNRQKINRPKKLNIRN